MSSEEKKDLFPRLPWRPYPLLFFQVFLPDTNLIVCGRIVLMMREFRSYWEWCTKNGPTGMRATPGQIEEENDLRFRLGSHAGWVRKTRRTSGPNIIPRMALLKLERETEKRYRSHRRAWTKEFQHLTVLMKQEEDKKFAPTMAMINEIMKDIETE